MRFFILSLLLYCAGCRQSETPAPPPTPAAAVVLEAAQLVDSFQTNLAALTNIAASASPAEISSSLRTFSAATEKWKGDYVILRAKMMVKGVAPIDEDAIVERYRRVRQDSKTSLKAVSLALRPRSDLQTFEPELKRANETLDSLPPR